MTDEEQQVIRQVYIAASGGNTSINEHSYVLFEEGLAVCCGDSVFCLAVPDLTLLWQTKADTITCFGVFAHENDLIVHGELSISRLTKEGAIIWQFSASDIFVSLTSTINFRIEGRTIYVIDWDGIMYEVDAETGRLLREYREQPSADQLRATANIDTEKDVRGKLESLSKGLRSLFLRLLSFFRND
ncbi:PQQ-binding-like beta-propeller repeat protein [Spirosoma oryzae]|uniref:PQQ-binding-like beta-propeller repeat protein n=1 Tax=Spirosoma oryzae TaxID=1469603 RepID=UPI001B804A90|nr:PQQ-binding-like beta-propeller repeat protein [Spirosoma oryzae]